MAFLPPMPNTDMFVKAAKGAGLSVDDSALDEIGKILVPGLNKIGPSDDDLLKAFKAFEILTAAAITAAAADHVDFVGAAHIRRGLGWVCPLFPFC